MKRGPIIHGVLLIGALLLAYQTWTRDKTVKVERGSIALWTGAVADVKSVTYESERKTIRVERRTKDGEAFLWGKTTRTTVPPKKRPAPPPPATDAGAPAPEPVPEPEPEPKVTVNEYPVGKTPEDLFDGLAPLKAVRDLGTPSDAQRDDWKLTDAKTQLIVEMSGQTHTLILGGKVYGGRDRYVVDPSSGTAYVVPGEVLSPFEGSDAGLKPTKALGMDRTEVATATVAAGDRTRTLIRGDKAGPHGGKSDTWAGDDNPGEPDQTLANYMSNLDKLAPSEYLLDDPQGLEVVLKVDYKDKAGKVLETLSLFKQVVAGDPTKADYYIRTKTTRVTAKTLPTRAKRIEADVGQLFGDALAPPQAPAPAPMRRAPTRPAPVPAGPATP